MNLIKIISEILKFLIDRILAFKLSDLRLFKINHLNISYRESCLWDDLIMNIFIDQSFLESLRLLNGLREILFIILMNRESFCLFWDSCDFIRSGVLHQDLRAFELLGSLISWENRLIDLLISTLHDFIYFKIDI